MLATVRLFAQQSKFEMNGTCSISQAGDCRMASDPFEVKITLDIDQKTGRIAMEEFWKNEKGNFEKKQDIAWSGEVLSKSNIRVMRFTQVRQFNCGKDKRSETLHFIGVVDFSNGYSVKLQDRYAMCPASNCIFDIDYSLILKAK